MKARGFRIDRQGKTHSAELVEWTVPDPEPGEVTVAVEWSGVNYKDALAGTGRGAILRTFPLFGGIDLAGRIAASNDSRFKEGDAVLVTGCGLSETRNGGYAEYNTLDADIVVPLPAGLSSREAMALGTAGFTAGLSLLRMEQLGQHPEQGPVLVTGATGGVGSLAIQIFSAAGYDVHAITGKPERFDYLTELGALQCISRQDLYWGERPLESQRWAGAIDSVGGEMLEGLLRVIAPWGNVASCGLAGGFGLKTTVMPFIIRGVSLIGINSAGCPMDLRLKVWERLSGDLKPALLDNIVTREITLEQLEDTFALLLDSHHTGRTVVRISA